MSKSYSYRMVDYVAAISKGFLMNEKAFFGPVDESRYPQTALQERPLWAGKRSNSAIPYGWSGWTATASLWVGFGLPIIHPKEQERYLDNMFWGRSPRFWRTTKSPLVSSQDSTILGGTTGAVSKLQRAEEHRQLRHVIPHDFSGVTATWRNTPPRRQGTLGVRINITM